MLVGYHLKGENQKLHLIDVNTTSIEVARNVQWLGLTKGQPPERVLALVPKSKPE